MIKLHSEPIFALNISPDGTNIVTGGGDSSIFRTRIHTKSYHNVYNIHNKNNHNNMYNIDKKEDVFEITNNNQDDILDVINEIPLKHSGTSCIRHRSDGRMIVSGHWDSSIRIFDQKLMKPIAILR